MKNYQVKGLINLGFLKFTANTCDVKVAYRLYKLQKLLNSKLTDIVLLEKQLLEQRDLMKFLEQDGKFKKDVEDSVKFEIKQLFDEIANENNEIDFELFSFEEWHQLSCENSFSSDLTHFSENLLWKD